MDLATRLKSFLTPDQIEKLSVALENIEMREWTKNNPPAPSPAPDKILDWESGDWWSDLAGGCWQHRGNKCRMLEVDGTLSDWRVTARPIAHGEFRLDDADGDKRAASKGYSVHRTAKVEPTRAVFEFREGDVVTRLCGENGYNNFYLYRNGMCYRFTDKWDIESLPPMPGAVRAGIERDLTPAEISNHLSGRGITAKFPQAHPRKRLCEGGEGQVWPRDYRAFGRGVYCEV